jgi:SAM-dependent methyltransferase
MVVKSRRTPLRLDIGAGALDVPTLVSIGGVARPDGAWTTVDAYTPADIRAEMWRLPLPDGSVEAIWSSHALEHVPREMVQPTLREWLRVLRPGGKVTIRVPNLNYACAHWLAHPEDPFAIKALFGSQDHEGEFHKHGWNLASFRADLSAADFALDSLTTEQSYGQQTLVAEVHRAS